MFKRKAEGFGREVKGRGVSETDSVYPIILGRRHKISLGLATSGPLSGFGRRY